MSISKEDRDRITGSIRSAEAKTSGEIVCVLAESSTRTTASPVFIAALAALILPWLLTALTAMTVYQILSLQVVVFLALLMLLCVPRIRVALMARRARRAIAYQVAMEQFVSRGLARNRSQSGILIFVSLAERYARIIVGTAIAARVPQSRWQAAVDALIAHMRSGQITEGFIAAIEMCGEELAKHFPPDPADRNELPDRIYLI